MTSTTQCAVFTKPECPQCDKTKAYFDAGGITYTAVDLTGVPTVLDSQAPVVVNNSDDQGHWSGLRRDKLVQADMTRAAA